MKRIIEIGSPAYLKTKDRQLVIERQGLPISKLAVEDIAALILDCPQALINQRTLSFLQENRVVVITCDTRHQPVGMLLPLQGHTLLAERQLAQSRFPRPKQKALWQQIIRSKLAQQAQLLEAEYGSCGGIRKLIPKVKSGDPDNIEAQAARRYWRRLFAGTERKFSRNRDAHDFNRFLNYGYAILRALTTRAICGSGLNPSLGLHHHNRYSDFCLADDLMEPFRPQVDKIVIELAKKLEPDHPLDPTVKAKLIGVTTQSITMASENMPLQHALTRSAQSLAAVIIGSGSELLLPH